MMTTAPSFLEEFSNSPAGFALTVAERLMWLTAVPIARFAFWLPNPAAAADGKNMVYCYSNNYEREAGKFAARFSTSKNTTFQCVPTNHKLNVSLSPGSYLQTDKTVRPLHWEVGVYPFTDVFGDTTPSIQVANSIVELADASDQPERKLLRSGLWEYKAGRGVKFHGLFPAFAAFLPGTVPKQHSGWTLPLGPNPGGHGAEPAMTPPPGVSEEDAKKESYLANVDAVVEEANKVNTGVKDSLEELQKSMARASAAHAAWMNNDPYKLVLPLDQPYSEE